MRDDIQFHEEHFLILSEIEKDRLLIKDKHKFIFDYVSKDSDLMIAGGSIRDILFNNEISDFDLFSTNKESLDRMEEFLVGINYKRVYNSDKLKTYKLNDIKIQLIYRHYENLRELLQDFDFTVCQFGFHGNRFWCTVNSILDATAKRLITYNVSPLSAFSTLRRTYKYQDKGYKICNKELKKIVEVLRNVSSEVLDKETDFYPDGTMRVGRFD